MTIWEGRGFRFPHLILGTEVSCAHSEVYNNKDTFFLTSCIYVSLVKSFVPIVIMGALLPSARVAISLTDTVKFPKQHPTPGDIPLALRALLTGAASCSQRAVTAPYQLLFFKIKLISKRLYVQYFREPSAEISLFTR